VTLELQDLSYPVFPGYKEGAEMAWLLVYMSRQLNLPWRELVQHNQQHLASSSRANYCEVKTYTPKEQQHTFHPSNLPRAWRHARPLLENHLRPRHLPASVAPLPWVVRLHRPGRGRTRAQPTTRRVRVEGRGSCRTERVWSWRCQSMRGVRCPQGPSDVGGE